MNVWQLTYAFLIFLALVNVVLWAFAAIWLHVAPWGAIGALVLGGICLWRFQAVRTR
jgi:hypothetical protein